MQGQLIQLLGDGIEELYWTPSKEPNFDEKFKKLYKEWENRPVPENEEELEETFEDWIENHPLVDVVRVFVEEVYV